MIKTAKKNGALWMQMKGGIKPNGHGRVKPPPAPRPRQTPIAKRSALKKIEDAAYNREAAPWKKDRPCQCSGHLGLNDEPVCKLSWHLCEDVHHKKGRVRKLLMDKNYWMAVCRAAHSWIEANRKEAYSRGWLLPGWNQQNPRGSQP